MNERFEMIAGSVVEMNRYVQKIKDMEMKKLGLRAAHTMCLYYLGRHSEGLTSSQLTELCREDKAAVSRNLNELLAKGYVIREELENKRSYRSPYFLTEQGREIVQTINVKIAQVVFAGGHGLTREQRENFYEAMEIILKNLADYVNPEIGES